MPKTILLADDDEDIREIVSMLLEEEGYVVRLAINGLEALQYIQYFPPDLAILDLRMPIMNGIECIEHLPPSRRSIPVIVFSAGITLFEEVQRLPVAALLSKPFDVDNLLKTVRDALIETGV